MEVVNRLGGEGKMDGEELNRIFNDAAVKLLIIPSSWKLLQILFFLV